MAWRIGIADIAFGIEQVRLGRLPGNLYGLPVASDFLPCSPSRVAVTPSISNTTSISSAKASAAPSYRRMKDASGISISPARLVVITIVVTVMQHHHAMHNTPRRCSAAYRQGDADQRDLCLIRAIDGRRP